MQVVLVGCGYGPSARRDWRDRRCTRYELLIVLLLKGYLKGMGGLKGEKLTE